MRIIFQRDYYRNRQLMQELPQLRGALHGIVRTWHRNGRLASRTRFRNGFEHGLAKQWNDEGKLLGEYRMQFGNGVVREWHDNGKLRMEISMQEGEFCGRSRRWLVDGTLFYENFYVRGASVTRAAYGKAQRKDKELPFYHGLDRKGYLKPRISESYIEDLSIRTMLKNQPCAEAREWLGKKNQKPGTKHLLGRFKSQKAALDFVEAMHQAGAVRLPVPGVYSDKRGNQFADVCLVQLPKSKTARLKIRTVCKSIVNQELGSLTPERDRGEKYILIGMW